MRTTFQRTNLHDEKESDENEDYYNEEEKPSSPVQ
jgi:hypothetical protein